MKPAAFAPARPILAGLKACAVASALVALVGCGATPATGARPLNLPAIDVAGVDAPFEIEGLVLSATRLVGAEGFNASLLVPSPVGRAVTTLGLSTPYETTLQRLSPRVPMAIAGGVMVFKVAPFKKLPVTGAYPLKIWLVNEHGEASNKLDAEVTVQ